MVELAHQDPACHTRDSSAGRGKRVRYRERASRRGAGQGRADPGRGRTRCRHGWRMTGVPAAVGNSCSLGGGLVGGELLGVSEMRFESGVCRFLVVVGCLGFGEELKD